MTRRNIEVSIEIKISANLFKIIRNGSKATLEALILKRMLLEKIISDSKCFVRNIIGYFFHYRSETVHCLITTSSSLTSDTN